MWKALVVDDNFINRKLLLTILKEKADCDVAVDGKEAIEAYNFSLEEKKPYDIILLDISMPYVNGLQVLEYIRENEKMRGVEINKGIPVIMVTAHKEPFLDAFDKGCDDYLIKPVNAAILLNKIEEKINNIRD